MTGESVMECSRTCAVIFTSLIVSTAGFVLTLAGWFAPPINAFVSGVRMAGPIILLIGTVLMVLSCIQCAYAQNKCCHCCYILGGKGSNVAQTMPSIDSRSPLILAEMQEALGPHVHDAPHDVNRGTYSMNGNGKHKMAAHKPNGILHDSVDYDNECSQEDGVKLSLMRGDNESDMEEYNDSDLQQCAHKEYTNDDIDELRYALKHIDMPVTSIDAEHTIKSELGASGKVNSPADPNVNNKGKCDIWKKRKARYPTKPLHNYKPSSVMKSIKRSGSRKNSGERSHSVERGLVSVIEHDSGNVINRRDSDNTSAEIDRSNDSNVLMDASSINKIEGNSRGDNVDMLHCDNKDNNVPSPSSGRCKRTRSDDKDNSKIFNKSISVDSHKGQRDRHVSSDTSPSCKQKLNITTLSHTTDRNDLCAPSTGEAVASSADEVVLDAGSVKQKDVVPAGHVVQARKTDPPSYQDVMNKDGVYYVTV